MNCQYCQKEMLQISDGDGWTRCVNHEDVVVWCKKLSNEIQQWRLEYGTWLCWDEHGFRITDNERGKEKLLLKLDYHPKIRPEEARAFVLRVMKMMVFS